MLYIHALTRYSVLRKTAKRISDEIVLQPTKNIGDHFFNKYFNIFLGVSLQKDSPFFGQNI